LTWAIAAALISLVMFRRYLRSFRAYSLEVFSTFAEVPTIRGVVHDLQEGKMRLPDNGFVTVRREH
jgi:hypothetical protein